MASIQALAKEFLSQKCIAVAGVSANHETSANLIYRTLAARGTRVLAVNPHCSSFDGAPCYPDIASLPEKPDGVVMVTTPAVAESLVRQCIDRGVKRVWMHDVLGTKPRFMKKAGAKITSVSADGVELCRRNDIIVIPGSCPMQFIGDVGHRCMRAILSATGAMQMPA